MKFSCVNGVICSCHHYRRVGFIRGRIRLGKVQSRDAEISAVSACLSLYTSLPSGYFDTNESDESDTILLRKENAQ